MKIVQEDFHISTKKRNQMVDITGQVRSVVRRSGISDGDVIVYCPHTTAAITINENADPAVPYDILLTLQEVIPDYRPGYRHSEGNSDAHTKSSIVGCSKQILVKDKSLVLGTWQAVFFCEFDGPRSRKVFVQARGE
ncbi:MAG: secondary thiamine-phosphate synthase enzyme YjbQ [Planctomycetota bacterium]|jgi:secondary thiamine-phosphate synthase enzyme